MSYDPNKLVKLEGLKQLSEKVKGVTDTLETKANATATYATKAELDGYAKKEDITSVYKPAGTVDKAGLSGLNVDSNLGKVYNVSEEFTADSAFIDSEVGKTYPAGTNVAVVQVEEEYKLDALAGFVDLSDYVKNEALATYAQKSDLEEYTKTEVLETTYAKKTDLDEYTKTEELDKTYAKKDELPVDFTGPSEAAGTHGLVPAPQVGDGEKYLKADGSWDTPHDTTYEEATSSQAGLMSATDKEKLDGIKIAEEAEVTEMLNEVFAAE